MEKRLGIKFQHLQKAFTDRFVPKLMDLALKDLRKAAEQEMGGIQTGGIASQNVDELKTVLQKTTKVTKVSRSDIVEKAEDVTHEVEMADKESDDEDEEDKSMDIINDTDGNQKKTTFKYDDDLQSEAGSSNVAMSEQGETLGFDFTED